MQIEVTREVVEAISAAADQEYPREACGILFGEGNRISAFCKTRNVHPTPETHFEIDPSELITAHRNAREGGPQIIGYFHSHPNGEPLPSENDKEMASGDGRMWVIIGDGQITVSLDKGAGFQTLSYAIVDH